MLNPDLLMWGFQLIVALTSVLSERMLARGKLYGWILLVLASILSSIFFLLREQNILALLEGLYVPIAIYGFYKWKLSVNKVTNIDKMMTYGAIVIVIVYFLCEESGAHRVHHLLISWGFLMGIILIARKKKLGWYLCILADTLLAYVLLETNDYIFVGFQGYSIYISIQKIFFSQLSTTMAPKGHGFLNKFALLIK